MKRKGISLPINIIIILVLLIVVLIFLTSYIMKSSSETRTSMNAQKVFSQVCSEQHCEQDIVNVENSFGGEFFDACQKLYGTRDLRTCISHCGPSCKYEPEKIIAANNKAIIAINEYIGPIATGIETEIEEEVV